MHSLVGGGVQVPTLPDWEKVYFLAEGGSAVDINTTLSMETLGRAFAFEVRRQGT